jgi:hypothetical protein
MEVTRSYRASVAAHASDAPLPTVTLAPDLVTRGLPAVVDTVQMVWPCNPFDPLPGGEAGVSGVLEYTLRNGDAPSEAALALPTAASSDGGPPMRFVVVMGACWAGAVHSQ